MEKRILIKAFLAILSIIILPSLILFDEGVGNRFTMQRTFLDSPVDFSQVFFDGIELFSLSRLFLFLMILIVLSFIVHTAKNRFVIPAISFRKVFLVNALLLFVVLFFSYLPLIIVFGNLGPVRASAPVGYILCLSFFFWAIIWGAIGPSVKIIIPAVAGSVLMLLMLTYLFYSQYHYNSRYAKAYDERIAYIKSDAHCNDQFIFVSELPDPGVIAGQEVSRIDQPPYSLESLLLGKLNGVDKLVFLVKE